MGLRAATLSCGLAPAALAGAAEGTGPSAARPLWEPDDRAYFGEGGVLPEPKRFSKLTVDDFSRLGSSGVPFVISDGCTDCPMKAWNCEEMSRKFSGVKFRQEYGRGESNTNNFGDNSWVSKKTKIKRRKPLPKDAPQYAPFYSDLVKAWRDEKERGWGKKQDVMAMEKAVKDASEPFYFMDSRNGPEMKQNPEFWLQPPETGSMAHMDEHCISTIATTLSGVKRWRLMPIPAKPHPHGYFDGLVYDRGEWDPLFNFTTHPGESVVFPPGFIHEGLSVGDDCVASITYQYTLPAPVAYFRSFFPRVRKTKDMQNCLPMVRIWATLNDRAFKPVEFGAAEAYATKLGRQLDADGDGELSLKEVLPRFSAARARGKDAKLLSTESLAYHDMNADGHTTVDEFATAFAAWSAVEFQAKQDRVVFRDEM